MKRLLAVFVLIATVRLFAGEPVTVFVGTPSVRVTEDGVRRARTELSRSEAQKYQLRITRDGDEYFWASRENRRVVLASSLGAFVTFVDPLGSGYVRIVKSDSKDAADLGAPNEATPDYVEHLTLGLTSITYWGVADK